jgi:hypothetical protein
MCHLKYHRFHVNDNFHIQHYVRILTIIHWGKADDRNCNYGHPKMADVESGKNLFCRLNCFKDPTVTVKYRTAQEKYNESADLISFNE